MKKVLPLIAVLGGAAALVMYKMKKDEQKKIEDLDEGLLYDDDADDQEDSSEPKIIVKQPIQKEEPVQEDVQETPVVEDELGLGISIDLDTVSDVEYDETYTNISKNNMIHLKELTEENIAQLEELGDLHDKERPVSHTLFFDNVNDMHEFNHEVINRGYVVTKGATDKEIVVLHITPIDEEKILEHVYYLANACNRKGAYIKWETKPITE